MGRSTIALGCPSYMSAFLSESSQVNDKQQSSAILQPVGFRCHLIGITRPYQQPGAHSEMLLGERGCLGSVEEFVYHSQVLSYLLQALMLACAMMLCVLTSWCFLVSTVEPERNPL